MTIIIRTNRQGHIRINDLVVSASELMRHNVSVELTQQFPHFLFNSSANLEILL